MSEISLGQKVVSLDNFFDVLPVNSHGYAHQHVLRSLNNFSVDLQQITALQSFKTEVIVAEISAVYYGGIKSVRIGLNNLVVVFADHGPFLLCEGLFHVVQIGHHICKKFNNN